MQLNDQSPKEEETSTNFRTHSAGLEPLRMSSPTNPSLSPGGGDGTAAAATAGEHANSSGRGNNNRYSMSTTADPDPLNNIPLGAMAPYKISAKVRRLERIERSQRSISSNSRGGDANAGPRSYSNPTYSSGGGRLDVIHSIKGPFDESAGGVKSPSSEVTPLVFGSDGSGKVAMPDMGDFPLDGNINIDSVTSDGPTKPFQMTAGEALWDAFFGKPLLSVLLIFVPIAIASHHLHWSPSAIFWLNFLAMVPLASILGDFTEEVAAHTNQVIGGLVNATFGNVVELLVAIQALLKDEIRVVQASMLGSIFSNLLLVLGSCFFFGGLRHKEQTFNATAATANMSLLALSSIALVLPTPFAEYYDIQDENVLHISRLAAVFLVLMYIQLLVFQLKTHVHIFEDDDDEEPMMSMTVAILGLCFVTFVLAILSDYLVESIDGYVESSGVSRTFVGLIILPLVGNAVEHMTAVNVAMKDKMDLAMGVAVGSCTQISLFVVPFTVIFGWIFDKRMTLNFPHFEIMLYVLSVFTVSICLSNPSGNWLEGSLLITTYLMIALGFWYEDLEDF
mmetsp:Transcript_10893/g.16815  ORF Transcript_10893/g.16815 Transcript_10893/m.16815 type:complete len:564 (-) Transcript_10893:225-1916(-)|eukprot:CAMPEP_0195294550 /NCGR_PEP_ID=MMETSP0707-20130614/15300_1 /TAXON_ID=33640 /ORGANISM="Asterionellopsis glacialis, Strain CCMP134" /LENGTH=563 /DNA_ID=CAMNT_0040355553 /DNA_START=100 /DNA_END=1791 /DNA_ORIENTATION=-